jgi:NAD+ synthetase
MENIANLNLKFVNDYGKSISQIRVELENYILSHNLKSLVLGVSGGIDSALVAALSKPVCDKLGIPLIGRSISIVTNKKDEESRANAIGMAFCNDFENIDLSEEFYVHQKSVAPQGATETDIQYKIRLGNVKARIRMINLYDLAAANRGLVMSTDNFTELLLGFWTLHGDVGDLGIIQQLWKTEVYKMADYLIVTELKSNPAVANALDECVTCNATDGLGITSTDLDQILPDWKERHKSTMSGYREVDEKLIAYIESNIGYDEIIAKRMRKTQFKRENPVNFPREIVFA